MQFDPEFFKEETRHDFTITKEMKHAWAALLEILSDIDSVCRQLGIRYFSFWGTMLGAVRHQGFIPWDDDIDIAMKRSDYERFRRKASAFLPDVYMINTMYTEDPERRRDDHLMRVNNGKLIRFDDAFLTKFHGFPYVTGIDILALDCLPADKNEENLLRSLVSSISLIREAIRSVGYIPDQFKEELKLIASIGGQTLSDDPDRLYWQLLKLTDQLFISANQDNATEITTYARNIRLPDFRFPKGSFDDFVMMPFEGFSIPVAADYDRVLRVQFGDNYMTPCYWYSHDYPFFKPQQEQIRELLGYIPTLKIPAVTDK